MLFLAHTVVTMACVVGFVLVVACFAQSIPAISMAFRVMGDILSRNQVLGDCYFVRGKTNSGKHTRYLSLRERDLINTHNEQGPKIIFGKPEISRISFSCNLCSTVF